MIEKYAVNKKKPNELTKLLQKYNNFHEHISVINVVGTNGKGSTSFYLSKQLQVHHAKVGLFISPAFLYHNERIQLNSKFISDDLLYHYLDFFKEDLINNFQLTFFEIWTLIAMKYFYDEKVNIAVIEAGIGGLQDSTKLFSKQLAICLTSISKDHIPLLGNTIKSIIDNKVGIRHDNGTPIFSANSNLKYKNFLCAYANIFFASKYLAAINLMQADNCGIVISILNYLNLKIDFKLFNNYPLLGRFTIVKNDPQIILDGAHNYDAIVKLTNIIKIQNIKNPIIVYASSDDKDYNKILKFLKYNFVELYISNFKYYRSWNINKIMINNDNKIDNSQLSSFVLENKNRNIIFCGSIYFISEVYTDLILNKITKSL